MKTLLYSIFFLCLTQSIYSQDLPDDCYILRMMYGKCDKGNKQFIRSQTRSEKAIMNSNGGRVSYGVVYKHEITIDKQRYILAVIESSFLNIDSYNMRPMGYIDYCFFNKSGNNWNMVSSIISEEQTILSDSAAYNIINLGNDKPVLTSYLVSRGHHDFIKILYFNEVSLHEIKYLMQVEYFVTNAFYGNSEDDTKECNGREYEQTYQIIKSDKLWPDVKIRHTNYRFSKGCKERIFDFVEEYLHVYGTENELSCYHVEFEEHFEESLFINDVYRKASLGSIDKFKETLLKNKTIYTTDEGNQLSIEIDSTRNCIFIQSWNNDCMSTCPSNNYFLSSYQMNRNLYKIIFSCNLNLPGQSEQLGFKMYLYNRETKQLTKDTVDKVFNISLEDFFLANTPKDVIESYHDFIEPVYRFEDGRIFCGVWTSDGSSKFRHESYLVGNEIEIKWNGSSFVRGEVKPKEIDEEEVIKDE